MSSCPRCQGCLSERYDDDTRTVMTRCLNCGCYLQWLVPTPIQVEVRGSQARIGREYVCPCGRPKVLWRSLCSHCLYRRREYQRVQRSIGKQRTKRATRKAMA